MNLLVRCFHEYVNDSYIEYFIQDLLKNVSFLARLGKWIKKNKNHINKQKVMKQIMFLQDVINEEIMMLESLKKERNFTPAEIKILDLIKKVRNSTDITCWELNN